MSKQSLLSSSAMSRQTGSAGDGADVSASLVSDSLNLSYAVDVANTSSFKELQGMSPDLLGQKKLKHPPQKRRPSGFLEHHTDWTCKLTNYLRNVVYIMSSWLVVCFTLDRYIAVRHPLQRSRLCTETRAKVIILCVFVFALVCNIYQLVYMEKLDRVSHNKCHAPKSKRIDFFAIEYFMFAFLLRFFVPFVIICVFNGRIIYHIRNMPQMRSAVTRGEKWLPSRSSSGAGGASQTSHTAASVKMPPTALTTSNPASAAKRTNQAITTLFSVCLVFIVTLSPTAIITVIQFIQFHTLTSKDLLCDLMKAESPLQMVRLSNYAINFIIYGFTGRQFRRELGRLLRRRRPWSESNGYQACQMRAQEMVLIRTNLQALNKTTSKGPL